MTSNSPDFYGRRVAHAGWTWREAKACSRFMYPPRRKDRSYSRADKRSARQDVRAEIDRDSTFVGPAFDPCANGTCPFCHGFAGDTDFERTRMAAAQRGAI